MRISDWSSDVCSSDLKFSGPDQAVSSTEKLKLLGFLRRAHGKNDAATEESAPRQITLKRRKVEEITVPAGKGKSKVAVEVRPKRPNVKRSDVAAPADAERVDAQRKVDEVRAHEDAIVPVQLGRPACRERVCQYEVNYGVARS